MLAEEFGGEMNIFGEFLSHMVCKHEYIPLARLPLKRYISM